MTSGAGEGGEGTSGFLRFFEFALCDIAFELGSAVSVNGGIFNAAVGTCAGGGDSEGSEEGGEYVVISTDGERARLPED